MDGKDQPVTVNLRDILQRVHHKSSERFLWADAVCINQEDLEERGQQVKMMGSIFRNVNHVAAWLGEEDEGDAEETSALIHEMAMYVQEQIITFGHMTNVPELSPMDLPRFRRFL
jgi:hypothetical protein